MFGLDWFGRKKKKALKECVSAAMCLNVDQYDSVWQNSVKDCMAKKGYKHDGRPGPSASIAAAYSRK